MGACMTILASFSFAEDSAYADLLLANYVGIVLPPLVNLVANLSWVFGALMVVFLSLLHVRSVFRIRIQV